MVEPIVQELTPEMRETISHFKDAAKDEGDGAKVEIVNDEFGVVIFYTQSRKWDSTQYTYTLNRDGSTRIW